MRLKPFGFRHGTFECDRTNRSAVPHTSTHIVRQLWEQSRPARTSQQPPPNPASSYHSHPLPFTPALSLSKGLHV